MINYGLDGDQEEAIKKAIEALEERITMAKYNITVTERKIADAGEFNAAAATIFRLNNHKKEIQRDIDKCTSAIEHLRSLVTEK